jgi:hypothetical protein
VSNSGGVSGAEALGGSSGTGGSTSSGGETSGNAGTPGVAGGPPYVPGPDDPCATVLLVLDRSTSMFSSLLPHGGSAEFGAHPDRWEALRAAVAGLEPHSADLAFGAMTFTGFSASNGSGECPVVETATAFALNGFDAILDVIPPSEAAIPETKGETPTADALRVAYDLVAAVPGDAPKYVVLLTDGLPELCGLFDQGTWCGQDPAIGAVQDARALGITTYAVGIGMGPTDLAAEEAESAAYFLNALAHAGQGLTVAPPPATYHPYALSCVQYEYQLISGTPTGTDLFNGGWRNYVQTSYGEDGSTFPEQLHLSPAADSLQSELLALIQSLASCR